MKLRRELFREARKSRMPANLRYGQIPTGKTYEHRSLSTSSLAISSDVYRAFVPDSQLKPQAFHVLIALAARDHHGYGIMQDVASRTECKSRLGADTLYGLIKRLLEESLIDGVAKLRGHPNPKMIAGAAIIASPPRQPRRPSRGHPPQRTPGTSEGLWIGHKAKLGFYPMAEDCEIGVSQ
jgi:hypothetical protein